MKAQSVWKLGAIGLILFLAVATAENQQNNRRDGNWWREQNAMEKYTYITGFFDGTDLGHHFSYWKIVSDKEHDQTCAGQASDSFGEYSDKYLKNVTSSQLADGLDKFYEDFRNRRIRIADAVWLVLNEIAGKSPSDMEKMIENWRKNALD